MKIAVEGMDGVGKTSVSKKLAAQLNYKYYEQKLVDQLGMDKDLYSKIVKYIRKSNNKQLSAIFYTFRCMLDNEDNIDSVVERSITSLVYFERDNIEKDLLEMIIQLGVIPDLTFLLYAPLETRIERIKQRNPFDQDLKSKEAMSDGYDVMLNFVHEYDIPYVGIDTTNISENMVVELCKNIAKGYEMCPDNRKNEYLTKLNNVYGFDDLYEMRGKKLCRKPTM